MTGFYLHFLGLTFIAALMVLIPARFALAQGMMDDMSCPMCGPGMMIIGGALGLAVIAALLALTIYLVRHSRDRSQGPGHA